MKNEKGEGWELSNYQTIRGNQEEGGTYKEKMGWELGRKTRERKEQWRRLGGNDGRMNNGGGDKDERKEALRRNDGV